MRVSLIVARSLNGIIGRDGDLPWHLSADLRRFKKLTMGHHMVMGRKTFESIGRLLPGRKTVVVTRSNDFDGQGALVANSLEQALQMAAADDEIFVVGGGEVYRQAIPLADRIYMTVVQTEVEGDTSFPELNRDQWQVVEQQHYAADEKNDYDHHFFIYDRVKNRVNHV